MKRAHAVPSDHPLFNPTVFFIPTPMIDDLRARIERWLWCGASGGYIVGSARIGKSRALQFLSHHLTTRTGEALPVVRINLKGRDKKTIASVWRNMLYAIGQAPASDRELSDTMSIRVTAYFAEQSLRNKNRQIVLVVDEFQRLLIRQLAAFAELYDELVELGVHLIVVFVGNEGESEHLLEQISDHQYEHLYGRFFMQRYHWHGLRSREAVGVCLKEFAKVKYPADTGPTLLQSFLPLLHKQDWHLTSLATPLWQIYREEYGKPLKLSSWPMQYFIATVKTLILDYLPRYGVNSPEMIEEMIRYSLAVSGLPTERGKST